MIEIDRLSKTYGGRQVVADLSLTIDEGALCVLLGPSGCGKSTTLRMINRLIPFDSGEIRVQGEDIRRIPPEELRRRIGYAIQSTGLFPHWRIEDNIATVPRLLGWPQQKLRDRVTELLELFRLNPETYRHKYPHELSGGEQQRVAIARAMIKTPAVFLFDEPLSNLDAKLRNHMRVEIARLHQRLGTTTIYVTHDQLEAMTLADRVVLLRDGRIEQVGTPRELFERPRTQFAASFVGTPAINFLDMKAHREKSETVLLRGNMAIRLRSGRLALGDGAPVVVGLRPAHLHRGPANGDAGRLSGRVDLVEFLGNEALATFQVGEVDVTALLPGRDPPGVGELIEVGIHGDDVHVFDAKTGLSLVHDVH